MKPKNFRLRKLRRQAVAMRADIRRTDPVIREALCMWLPAKMQEILVCPRLNSIFDIRFRVGKNRRDQFGWPERSYNSF